MGSIVEEMGSHGQQKRAGACHSDTFTLNGKSAFDESLQASRSEDAWKGPPRKG
jgi:hypothetical protein